MDLTFEKIPEQPFLPKAELLHLVVMYKPFQGEIVAAGRLKKLYEKPWVMSIGDIHNGTYWITCYAGECEELEIDPVEYIFNYLKGWGMPA